MSLIGLPYVKSHGLGGTSKREGLREYEVVYIVKSDATDGAFIVGNAPGLPSRGSTYQVPTSITSPVIPGDPLVVVLHPTEKDTGAILTGIVPAAMDRTSTGKVIWEVTCSYSSKGAGGNPSNEETSPILRLAKRDWGTANYIHYPHADLSLPPKDFKNTAGFPYDAVPVEETIVTLTITNPQGSFNPSGAALANNPDGTTALFSVADAKKYQNSVNSNTYYGALAGECLCKSIRGSEEFEDGIEYINVTYEFHFREVDDQGDGTAQDPGDPSTSAWQLQLMDKGPYHFVGAGGIVGGVKTAADAGGVPTTDHVKLNGIDGQKLDDDADAAYNLFKVRRVNNFNDLGV